jgi:DegV family protein with EDD domain
MEKIALITDSTCDLPEQYIQHYDITVIPHTIIWGLESFQDRIDITPEAFYERLLYDKQMPTTAQVSAYAYQQAFIDAKKKGYEQILVYTISGAMSGAINSAREAAAETDIPVQIVDGKGPTMSLGWQVLAAARLREAGETLQTILDKTKIIRESMVQLVMLDTLEFLHRGGRIGNAQKLIGSLLDIKPIVKINHLSGLVESDCQARTYTKAVQLLYKRFISQLDLGKALHIAVLHGNAMDAAKQLIDWIEKECHPSELIVNITGPVLGINTGPGALALCGYSE